MEYKLINEKEALMRPKTSVSIDSSGARSKLGKLSKAIQCFKIVDFSR